MSLWAVATSTSFSYATALHTVEKEFRPWSSNLPRWMPLLHGGSPTTLSRIPKNLRRSAIFPQSFGVWGFCLACWGITGSPLLDLFKRCYLAIERGIPPSRNCGPKNMTRPCRIEVSADHRSCHRLRKFQQAIYPGSGCQLSGALRCAITGLVLGRSGDRFVPGVSTDVFYHCRRCQRCQVAKAPSSGVQHLPGLMVAECSHAPLDIVLFQGQFCLHCALWFIIVLI